MMQNKVQVQKGSRLIKLQVTWSRQKQFMSYQGYNSTSDDPSRSFTEEYEIGHNNQQQEVRQQDLTYEESSRVQNYGQVLTDITNGQKIRISDALKKRSALGLCYFGKMDKSIDEPENKQEFKINNERINKIYDMPMQIRKKSRSKSLLYFQQNQHKESNKQQHNIPKPEPKEKQSLFAYLQQQCQINLPLQFTLKPPSQPLLQPQPSRQTKPKQLNKYFLQNQINTKLSSQILITNRSFNNQSVFDGHLDSLSRRFFYQQTFQNYENENIQPQEVSLKHKIQAKIRNDKNRRVKTLCDENQSNLNLKKVNTNFNPKTKSYKPIQPTQCHTTRTILSTQPFHNRQQKTLNNKQSKIQQLKQQKLQRQLKQCTFKPAINTRFSKAKSKVN